MIKHILTSSVDNMFLLYSEDVEMGKMLAKKFTVSIECGGITSSRGNPSPLPLKNISAICFVEFIS